MISHQSYCCKNCGHEIEVEVEINEGDDLPQNCPECKAVIPDSVHEMLAEQAAEDPT